jgi:hypothetical protein
MCPARRRSLELACRKGVATSGAIDEVEVIALGTRRHDARHQRGGLPV